MEKQSWKKENTFQIFFWKHHLLQIRAYNFFQILNESNKHISFFFLFFRIWNDRVGNEEDIFYIINEIMLIAVEIKDLRKLLHIHRK